MDLGLIQDVTREEYAERLRQADRLGRLKRSKRVIALPAILRNLFLIFG